MLLRSLDLIIDRPVDGLVTMGALLFALVIAITFHEFCHALSAKELGDLTAARQGRLSLNPLAHLDPLGSMMILLAGFGWGKPVPVNAYNLRFALGARRGMSIAPLDGFKVVLGLLPGRAAAGFSRLEPIGPIILLGLILLDYALPGPGILSTVIEPVFEGLARLVFAGHL